MLARLLDVLAPPLCLACGEAADDALCAACRMAMPWLRDACPRCALPRPCAPCPAARQRLAAVWAPVVHEGPARALVHALKFHAHLAAADVMAAQMAATLARAAATPSAGPPAAAGPFAERSPTTIPFADAPLVPVPFAPGRRRRRGYDPADLLASRLAQRTGLPLLRCLRRGGEGRQVGSPRAERLRAGGVVVEGRAPPVAMLVDDVHTTGATLDACARALASGGTRTIVAVTYARTVRRT
ncbi:MAG TPA: double zinc ribbon domain-containing protein [Solirubrobacteraceae bacterium]|jgi:predicted amidophosphoribosyltransferase